MTDSYFQLFRPHLPEMYSIREYLFRLGVTDIRLSEKPETCDTFELVWRTCKIGVSSSKEPKINGAIIAFHAQLELVTEISFDIKASLHLSKKSFVSIYCQNSKGKKLIGVVPIDLADFLNNNFGDIQEQRRLQRCDDPFATLTFGLKSMLLRQYLRYGGEEQYHKQYCPPVNKQMSHVSEIESKGKYLAPPKALPQEQNPHNKDRLNLLLKKINMQVRIKDTSKASQEEFPLSARSICKSGTETETEQQNTPKLAPVKKLPVPTLESGRLIFDRDQDSNSTEGGSHQPHNQYRLNLNKVQSVTQRERNNSSPVYLNTYMRIKDAFRKQNEKIQSLITEKKQSTPPSPDKIAFPSHQLIVSERQKSSQPILKQFKSLREYPNLGSGKKQVTNKEQYKSEIASMLLEKEKKVLELKAQIKQKDQKYKRIVQTAAQETTRLQAALGESNRKIRQLERIKNQLYSKIEIQKQKARQTDEEFERYKNILEKKQKDFRQLLSEIFRYREAESKRLSTLYISIGTQSDVKLFTSRQTLTDQISSKREQQSIQTNFFEFSVEKAIETEPMPSYQVIHKDCTDKSILQKVAKKNKDLEYQILSLSKQLDQETASNQLKAICITQFENKVQKLESQINSLNSELQNWNYKNKSVVISECQKQLSEVAKVDEVKAEDFQDIKQLEQDKELIVNYLQQNFDRAKKKVVELESNNFKFKSSNQSLKKKNQILEGQMEKLKGQSHNFRQNTEIQTKKNQGKNFELQKHISQLQEENEKLQTRLQQLQKRESTKQVHQQQQQIRKFDSKRSEEQNQLAPNSHIGLTKQNGQIDQQLRFLNQLLQQQRTVLARVCSEANNKVKAAQFKNAQLIKVCQNLNQCKERSLEKVTFVETQLNKISGRLQNQCRSIEMRSMFTELLQPLYSMVRNLKQQLVMANTGY